jgi:hypothetical protein
MLANLSFGAEWKPEKDFIDDEYENLGFNGRIGEGLPRINDGLLLLAKHQYYKFYVLTINPLNLTDNLWHSIDLLWIRWLLDRTFIVNLSGFVQELLRSGEDF